MLYIDKILLIFQLFGYALFALYDLKSIEGNLSGYFLVLSEDFMFL
jgi:hypothetical protein